MAAIIKFFLKKQDLPNIAEQFLQGNVIINTLELEAALSDMYVKQLNLQVQQGFFFEASLYARGMSQPEQKSQAYKANRTTAGSFQWSGYTCIEIRPGAFQFIMMMSPLQFATNSQTFFSLTRGALSAADYGIPKPKGKVDENMLKSGPVIYISNKNKERPLFMTAHLQLIAFTMDLTAVGDQNGFIINFQTSLDMGQLGLGGDSASLTASGRVVPNQRASFTLTITANISLTIPGIPLSGFNQNMFLPGKSLSSVGFSIAFSFEIGWPNTGTGFSLNLTAKVNALGKSFDVINVAVNLHPEQLDTLAKVANAAVQGFKDQFANSLKKSLEGLSIDQIGNFIKEHFNLGGKDLVTAVSVFSNTQPQDVIERLGTGILGLASFKEVLDLVSKYGLDAETATKIALKLFPLSTVLPFGGTINIPLGGSLPKTFGLPFGLPIPPNPTIDLGPIKVEVPVPPPVKIIKGLLDSIFSRRSVVQHTAPAWAPSAIVGAAMSREAIPVPPMAAVDFDNSSALGVERAPQNATQALEAAAAALQAAREALQKAQEAYDLAVAASSGAVTEESPASEEVPASSDDVSAEEVSTVEVTAGASEEPQPTSAESTKIAEPLLPEASQAETSQPEPTQAEPSQPETQDPITTVSIDPSMLPTMTADGTQIVWISGEQLAQLIEHQRIALLDAALSVYPIEEVYEASKVNFEDTTPEQIRTYLAAAGLDEDEIKALIESTAEEQPAQ